MARHAIYVDEATEQLIVELGLDKQGWTGLFKTGLQLQIQQQPAEKVRRALGRVSRRQAAAVVERLAPTSDGG